MFYLKGQSQSILIIIGYVNLFCLALYPYQIELFGRNSCEFIEISLIS